MNPVTLVSFQSLDQLDVIPQDLMSNFDIRFPLETQSQDQLRNLQKYSRDINAHGFDAHILFEMLQREKRQFSQSREFPHASRSCLARIQNILQQIILMFFKDDPQPLPDQLKNSQLRLKLLTLSFLEAALLIYYPVLQQQDVQFYFYSSYNIAIKAIGMQVINQDFQDWIDRQQEQQQARSATMTIRQWEMKVIEFENTICSRLNWNIDIITSCDFLDYFIDHHFSHVQRLKYTDLQSDIIECFVSGQQWSNISIALGCLAYRLQLLDDDSYEEDDEQIAELPYLVFLVKTYGSEFSDSVSGNIHAAFNIKDVNSVKKYLNGAEDEDEELIADTTPATVVTSPVMAIATTPGTVVSTPMTLMVNGLNETLAEICLESQNEDDDIHHNRKSRNSDGCGQTMITEESEDNRKNSSSTATSSFTKDCLSPNKKRSFSLLNDISQQFGVLNLPSAVLLGQTYSQASTDYEQPPSKMPTSATSLLGVKNCQAFNEEEEEEEYNNATEEEGNDDEDERAGYDIEAEGSNSGNEGEQGNANTQKTPCRRRKKNNTKQSTAASLSAQSTSSMFETEPRKYRKTIVKTSQFCLNEAASSLPSSQSDSVR